MEIERIEQWLGQTVVDREGEKLGKLTDLYFGSASGDAVAGGVKTGVLGRKVHVVSLTGATAGRNHLKLAFTKDQVKKAPQAESGTDLDEAQGQELGSHFDMRLPSATLESGEARAERDKRAAETAARAAELEEVANKKGAEAKEKEESAAAAEQERDQARREAEEARRAAEGPGG